LRRGVTISSRELRINEAIRVREVRVIGSDGQNLGVLPIQEALRLAREQGRDLVEVSPQANPPVCRILDYGKFLYEQHKKEREAKKAQKIIEVKEIRLRPKTDLHHRGFKVRDARRWLEQGMKVKVRIRFRGREITHPEVALQDLKEIAEELNDIATVEVQPNIEERTMLMVLAPAPQKKKAIKEKQPQEEVSRAQDQVPQSNQ
jgi:translation initiation factor IF-3